MLSVSTGLYQFLTFASFKSSYVDPQATCNLIYHSIALRKHRLLYSSSTRSIESEIRDPNASFFSSHASAGEKR